jgi:hypothetical protein
MQRRITRIQYTGCLHVDKFEKALVEYFIKPVANILILNGNIGNPENKQTSDFIHHCSKLWGHVLYIPGPIELQTYSNSKLLKERFITPKNVHILNNECIHINNVFFIATAYDKYWLRKEFEKNKDKAEKIVALTYILPDYNMIHPDDNFTMQPEVTPLPNFDAWISGYIRGAHTYTYPNNMLAAYNTCGPIDGDNDLEQNLGWSRTATLKFDD